MLRYPQITSNIMIRECSFLKATNRGVKLLFLGKPDYKRWSLSPGVSYIIMLLTDFLLTTLKGITN